VNKETVNRLIIFFCFFGTGLSVMTLSLLFDDFYAYYQNKVVLAEAKRDVDKLKKLNDDYNDLLRQLRSDEQVGRRLAAATFGVEPKEQGIAYPRETIAQLAAARLAVMEETERQSQQETMMPGWLERCKEPNRRVAIFLSGAVLILLAFVYFGPQTNSQADGVNQPSETIQ
jgi:hypothetical protein